MAPTSELNGKAFAGKNISPTQPPGGRLPPSLFFPQKTQRLRIKDGWFVSGYGRAVRQVLRTPSIAPAAALRSRLPFQAVFLPKALNFFFDNEPGEMLKRPVVCPFGIRRKKAAWYLPLANVVADTVATDSPLVAGIRACTRRFVLFNFTFHLCIGVKG